MRRISAKRKVNYNQNLLCANMHIVRVVKKLKGKVIGMGQGLWV